MAFNMDAAINITAGVKGTQAVDGLAKSLSSANVNAGLASITFRQLSGVLSVAAIAGFMKKTIDLGDSLNDLHIKTGISVETLSKLAKRNLVINRRYNHFCKLAYQ
jgi:hypothetical protein